MLYLTDENKYNILCWDKTAKLKFLSLKTSTCVNVLRVAGGLGLSQNAWKLNEKPCLSQSQQT